MRQNDLKTKAEGLRKRGFTYSEISKQLGGIPKTTLSTWLSELKLSDAALNELSRKRTVIFQSNHRHASEAKKRKRAEYFVGIEERNLLNIQIGLDPDFCKISLAMLYLGEGKKQSGSISFGNSNEAIIKLFLGFLRRAYPVDESKFRVTVQCRADQNIPELETYWQSVTKIPFDQFYKSRVDSRTIGIISKKPEYKGVCRIDYFSADVFNELAVIAKMMLRAVSSVG